MKFLIDECLSLRLATIARDEGYPESTHVSWLGRAGTKDWHLMPQILVGDWTFVTRNSRDFRGGAKDGGLFAAAPIHAGLVCLNGPNTDIPTSERLFRTALHHIASSPDLINQVVEVTDMPDEQRSIVDHYDLPSD
jgi:predicted nuclease of predicted toxin-antitoxin system